MVHYCLFYQEYMMHYLLLCLFFLFQVPDADSNINLNAGDANTAPQMATNAPTGTKWGYYYFLILNDNNIQKELRLSPSQLADMAKLREIFFTARAISKQAEDKDIDAKNHSKPQVPKEPPKKILGQLGAPTMAILTKDQKGRLDQIIFQLRKAEIFFYPEIAEEFRFSADQLKESQSVRSWMIGEAKKLHDEYVVKNKNSKEYRKRMLILLDEGRDRIVKSFSPEQLKKLEAMEGDKINFNLYDLNFYMRQEKPSDNPPSSPKEDVPKKVG
jgi:hypothetical protein